VDPRAHSFGWPFAIAAVLLLAGCPEQEGTGLDGGSSADRSLPDLNRPDSWSYDYRRPDAGAPDLTPLGPWNAEVVTEQASFGASIALDSSGQPRIAYHDPVTETLRLAERVGSWSSEEIEQRGRAPLLAQSGAGELHAVFARDHGGVFAVRYARRSGADWSAEEVDDSSWFSASVGFAVDGAGRAHVSYQEPEAQRLYYARRDGAAWRVELIDDYDPELDDRVGEGSAVAVTPAGDPIIAYAKSEEGTSYKLKLARYEGGAWRFEQLDGATYVWVHVDLALDAAGQAHLCYFDVDNHRLRYARESAAGWSYETVASVGIWSVHCAIAVGADGHARVVFNDSDQGTVNLARFDGSRWNVEVIDRGRYVDLALDGSGRPHVVYHDADPDLLKYAVPQ
jgi:hypothetical protein